MTSPRRRRGARRQDLAAFLRARRPPSRALPSSSFHN
jgi:hypothetical protein